MYLTIHYSQKFCGKMYLWSAVAWHRFGTGNLFEHFTKAVPGHRIPKRDTTTHLLRSNIPAFVLAFVPIPR
jgi:hypothetical protein